MKVIDLLNKIAKGEKIPEKIKYCDLTWVCEKRTQDYIYVKNGMTEQYLIKDVLSDYSNTEYLLSCELEIIEEPQEIEEIGSWYEVLETESKKTQLEEINHNFNVIFDRLETLIDVVNELKKENK